MSLLSRLETDLRGALARAFTDSRVSLVDVGRALLAEDAAAGPARGPRVFDVALTPDDLEGLRAHAGALCRRLAELVADRRGEQGDRGGPVDVRLVPDDRLRPGVFRVDVDGAPGRTGSGAAGGRPDSSAATRPGSRVLATGAGSGAAPAREVDDEPALPGNPRLVVALGGNVVSGTRFDAGRLVELPLDENVAVIGSASDANLLLPPSVAAPHHVEVRFRRDGFHEARAVDGAPLRVDGRPSAVAVLSDGVRLEVGGVSLVYRRDLSDRQLGLRGREGTDRTGPEA